MFMEYGIVEDERSAVKKAEIGRMAQPAISTVRPNGERPQPYEEPKAPQKAMAASAPGTEYWLP